MDVEKPLNRRGKAGGYPRTPLFSFRLRRAGRAFVCQLGARDCVVCVTNADDQAACRGGRTPRPAAGERARFLNDLGAAKATTCRKVARQAGPTHAAAVDQCEANARLSAFYELVVIPRIWILLVAVRTRNLASSPRMHAKTRGP